MKRLVTRNTRAERSCQVLLLGISKAALMDPYWTPRQNGIACKVIDSFGARTGSGKVTVVKANARWEVLAMNDLDEEV